MDHGFCSLGRQAMPYEPANELERSFLRAASDPAHRPQFHRDLLSADVFACQRGIPPSSGRVVDISIEEKMQLPVWEVEGREVIPFFSSLARLAGFVSEPVGYVQMKGGDFLALARGYDLFVGIALPVGRPDSSATLRRPRNDSPGGVEHFSEPPGLLKGQSQRRWRGRLLNARAPPSHSPMICTISSRSRARTSKSKKTICCQVPSMRRFSRKGMVTEAPMRLARTWLWPLLSCQRSSWW